MIKFQRRIYGFAAPWLNLICRLIYSYMYFQTIDQAFHPSRKKMKSGIDMIIIRNNCGSMHNNKLKNLIFKANEKFVQASLTCGVQIMRSYETGKIILLKNQPKINLLLDIFLFFFFINGVYSRLARGTCIQDSSFEKMKEGLNSKIINSSKN